MADLLARLVREGRRVVLLQQKKLSLAKYNFKVKTQMGQNPDAFQDAVLMSIRHKSMNLLDFENNREKDLYLMDVNSDRSQYGGASETELTIMQDTDGDTYRK